MKLTVQERLLLLGILPPEQDLATMRIVHKMREQLGFTEEEHALLKVRQEGTQIMWRNVLSPEEAQALEPPQAEEEQTLLVLHNTEGAEIPLGPKGQEIIRTALEKMDKDKKLREEHLTLCDKFEIGAE